MNLKSITYFITLLCLVFYTKNHAQVSNSSQSIHRKKTLHTVFDAECTNSLPGENVGDTGCITFVYQGQTVTYATVRAADGKVWLQQNMGSSQIATATDDALAYGDLFQWGRWDDGHQKRTSPTSGVPIPNNPVGFQNPSHHFITGSAPSWWSNNQLTDKWGVSTPQNVTEINGCDPCKALGEQWKMPSESDWAGLKNSENISNPSSAFASSLKLPAAGYRSNSDGGLTFTGTRLYYWSSTSSSSGAKYLYISSFLANPSAGAMRAQGASVRCLLEEQVASVTIGVQNAAEPAISTNNGTLQLTATILPLFQNQAVNWSVVSGAESATINSSGLVVAQANGTVLVKATSVLDNTKFDVLEITVSNQESSVEFPFPYCGDEGITSLTISEITEVKFGSISHISTIDGALAVSIENFTETVFNANQGTTSPVFIQGATQGQQTVSAYVYIDFNHNDIFEANETFNIGYLDNSNPISGVQSGTVSGNITIPTEALLGTTRFRVVKAYESNSWMGVLENLPCPSGWFIGQVEDYTIDIGEAIINPIEIESVALATENNVPSMITTNGGTLPLIATVFPVTANQAVIWTIEEGDGVVTITSEGLVTALSNGTVKVRAASMEDPTKFDEIEVVIVIETNPQEGYCEVTVEFDVEPITSVLFATINNTTSAIINGTPAYEDFASIIAEVNKQETYTLKVKGNTNGEFSHDIRVFIDWNQDEVFDMQNEYYSASLLPSTGEDSGEVSIDITVPNDAMLGITRMRIVKDLWNVYEPDEFDACTDAYYGQIEDYTVNIQEQTASNEAFNQPKVSIYPNPTTGLLSIHSQITIEKIELFDYTGKRVIFSKRSILDVSHLATGVYQVKIGFENGKQSFMKIIKK